MYHQRQLHDARLNRRVTRPRAPHVQVQGGHALVVSPPSAFGEFSVLCKMVFLLFY